MGRNKKPRKKHYSSQQGTGSGGGGSLMSMRHGFRGLVGGGKSKQQGPWQRFFDIVVWVALAAAVAFFIYRRFL